MIKNTIFKSVLSGLLALSFGAAQAATEIQWWHAMGGVNGERVNKIANDFNASQSDYRVAPSYKGNYTETMTAAIAAFRAKEQPHIVQVFEVGPSGCGKSTLMRMIAGLETVTQGTISIGGREVNNLEPADRDIAMVFQNYALYPHMNVFDNMAYGLKIRGLPKSEIQQRVKKAADILELTEDQLTRKPRQLSGGQRQRVAMGRAIVREPSVFLFDEPLSNLDAKLRVQMRIEIKLLQEQLGTTSVYVTHDQVEAMTLGHRLVVLNEGMVEQLGTPIELYQRPASLFVAGFIGSPAMNFASAQINADGSAVDLNGGVSFTLPEGIFSPYNNMEVVLGIRPEDLELADNGDDNRNLTTKLVEHLGSDTLVHGHFGEDQTDMTIRLAGIQHFKMGEVLPMHIKPDKIHLFDPKTEKRLD